jgi:hypothetical protein
MDVADWLRSLGLSQYEAAFRESEIDADVLPELTETPQGPGRFARASADAWTSYAQFSRQSCLRKSSF